MTAITTLDVAARYFFDAPLSTAVELVRLSLLTMVFAGLPIATARREHVTVGLLDSLFTGRLARIRQVMIDLIGTIVLAGLAVYAWLHAARLARAGETMMFLDIPVAPFAFGAAVLAGLSALVLLALVFRPATPRGAE